MKKSFLLWMLLMASLFYSQEKEFTITQNSFTDYIVTDVKGLKKEIIYKKTLEWIAKNFKSQNDVIKSKVANDFVRFEGVDKFYCVWDEYSKLEDKTYCYPTKFTIEVSVKDGKYKFDITSLKFFQSGGYGWLDVYEFEHGWENNSKEQIELNKELPNYFNKQNEDLKGYILGKKTSKDNW